ncbi:TPA: DNA topoisomerase III [Streptococcus equi subsp. zooepidemicus]|nr:DNA topoisomerase III [Streptococcus equi subsp. zooepidemicus]
MKLVIAEKPMLARDIARAICGKKVSETAPLPISGNGYTVIGCAGHLLELVEPEDINPKWGKPWTVDVLPIYSHDWKKIPTKDKKDLVEKIAKLLPEADCVIHAGDPDEEGQLIVDELLDYLGYDGDVWRVYVNDNIEKNIIKAFDNLKPNDLCLGDGKAAYARQMADKCFGINETRLATQRLGTLFSVGRVQTPTLGLVVNRDEAIKNHVKQAFYELDAIGNVNGQTMTFSFSPSKEFLAGEKHIFDKDILQQLKEALDNTTASFTTTVTETKKYPPLPYNLTLLLSDMSKRFGMTAAKTQDITQNLRDKYKAITYNRSDSQYLKEEHFTQAKAVLSQAMHNIGAHWELDFSLHSKAFNDNNVTAHHGIIPQEVTIETDKMTQDEKRVYTAIVERYAMQFLPPAIYDVSTSSFPVEHGEMRAVTKKIRDAGYLLTFGNTDNPEETTCINPWLDEGDYQLEDIACEILSKETTPPKPYTEGTLIADMASIAKYVSDPSIKAVLKQKDDGKKGEHGGIGTTATRASIIEKLKKRGYLEEQKGKIRSTEKARAFYHLLPNEIRSADVTAHWWLIQQEIANGQKNVNDLQDNVVEVFQNHQDSAYQGVSLGLNNSARVVGKCPLCGQDVLHKKSKQKHKNFYICSDSKNTKQADGTWKKEGCPFMLSSFAQKTLTPTQVTALLSGKTIPLKGGISKTGKTFNCKLSLTKDGKLTPTFQQK